MGFFDGVEGDASRFWPQYETVHHYMNDNGGGKWFRYAFLMEKSGAIQTSVSAHIRQMRKPKAGSHPWERRCVAPGVYEYRSWPSNVNLEQIPSTAQRNDEPGKRTPCPWCEPFQSRVRVKRKHKWITNGE